MKSNKMMKIIHNIIADIFFYIGRFLLYIGDYIIGISCKLHMMWKTDTGIILKNMENYIKNMEPYIRDRISNITSSSDNELKNSKDMNSDIKKFNGKIIRFRKKKDINDNL